MQLGNLGVTTALAATAFASATGWVDFVAFHFGPLAVNATMSRTGSHDAGYRVKESDMARSSKMYVLYWWARCGELHV